MSTAIDLITIPTTASFPHNIHSIMIPEKLPNNNPKSPKSPTTRSGLAVENSEVPARTSTSTGPHATKLAPPTFELTDESEESTSRGSQETQDERKLSKESDEDEEDEEDEEDGDENDDEFLTPKNSTPDKSSASSEEAHESDSDDDTPASSQPPNEASSQSDMDESKDDQDGEKSLRELAKSSMLYVDSSSHDDLTSGVSSETNETSANEETKEDTKGAKKVDQGAKPELITQMVQSLIPPDYNPPATSTRSKGIEVTRAKIKKTPSPELSQKELPAVPTRPKAAAILSNTFRRRSWMPSSRSPSPQKESQVDEGIPPLPPVPDLSAAVSQLSSSPSRSRLSTAFLGKSSNSRPVSAISQNQGFRRRLSSAMSLSKVARDALKDADGSNAPPLPKSKSAELLKLSRRSTLVGNLTPSSRSSDRLSTMGQLDGLSFSATSKSKLSKKRDELFKAFQDLDNACTKFNSKSSEQKLAVIHNHLSPFLEENEKHPSNFKLHPEDQNRRVRILHRWWIGLLEYMKTPEFNGCPTASKTEILESALSLMKRPEWIVYPSPFAQTFSKSKAAAADGISESTTSFESEMVVESLQQDIRNLMSEALMMQLAFAVEKLSSRTFASVVAFCSKTCAYAFFFCPGVATLMIKLWNVKLDNVKRVLEATGLSVDDNLTDTADRLSQFLPSPVKDVAYTTIKDVSNKLKRSPKIPNELRDVQWWGNWLDRWNGQDTDLFYGFVRNYYSLLFFFLPESTESERVVMAGGVFIQAQILANLNAAIGRYSPKPPSEVVSPAVAAANNALRLTAGDENGKKPIGGIANSYNITLDDVLADPDSSAVPLLPSSTPMNNPIHRGNPMNNADRAAAENRLILLIKDVLATKDATKAKSGVDFKGKAASQKSDDMSTATPSGVSPATNKNMRSAFAQLLATLLKAAALGTSQFNRFAAEILCNLMEEAVVTLARYENQQLQKDQKASKEKGPRESQVIKKRPSSEGFLSFIDWPFWFAVWKLMAMTNNYFTEIRVYSLIHSIWPAIALDESRKRALCESFLLERKHFETRFSHWSPMVRAYFMRLICWRVARVNDEEEDLATIELLEERLRDIYAYYLHIDDLAVSRQSMGPSTIPSNAAPNRRFVILRTEPGPKREGDNLIYDGLYPQSPAYKRALVLEQLSAIAPSGTSAMPPYDDRLNGLSAGSSIDSDREAGNEDSSGVLRPRWTSSSRLSTFIRHSTLAPDKSGQQSRSKSVSPSRNGTEAKDSPPTSTPDLKRLARESRSSLRPFSAMASTLSLSRPATHAGPKNSGNSSPSDEAAAVAFGNFRSYCFRFSLELIDRRNGPPVPVPLQHPRLPAQAQLLIANKLRRKSIVRARSRQRSNSTSSNGSIGFSAGLLGEIYAEFTGPDSLKPSNAALAAITAHGYLNEHSSGPSMVSPETTAAYCGRALAEWTNVVGECNMFFERRRHENVPNKWVETPLLGTEGLVRGPRG